MIPKPPKSEVKPISPDEIIENKKYYINPEILKIVNEILAKKYSRNGSVIIKLNEISELFFKRNPGVNRKKAFDEHLFDFEDAYRNEGWEVSFSQPSYDEDYDSYYSFKKKK